MLDEHQDACRPSRKRSGLALALFLLACFAAGAVGGIASANAGTFYASLERPAWAPSAWLFGPVWTVLYAMMGVAAWRIWRYRDEPGRLRALELFFSQLALNALWTWIFFAWRQGGWALLEIVVLLLLIVVTIVHFIRIDRLAGILLLPYLLWVGYAAALTAALWQRNLLRL